MGIARLARGIDGEFGRYGFTHDYCTSGTQERNGSSVFGRRSPSMKNRAVLGGHILCVENILDPHRYAMKGAERCVRKPQPIGFTGLVKRIGWIEKGPGLNCVLTFLDPGNTLLN